MQYGGAIYSDTCLICRSKLKLPQYLDVNRFVQITKDIEGECPKCGKVKVKFTKFFKETVR